MLLARARVVRRPFVYVAIGLPERLARLRSARMERLYAQALGSAAAVVAYSRHEADAVEGWLRERGVEARVEFVPFGVDADAFRPRAATPDLDVVSVGADPHRDFELLLTVARSRPDVGVLLVTTAEHARSLGDRPANVAVETDLPFDEMRDRLERARVVALPVRENSYSGATTVLLQAMALGKPVVVTRTAAIATGYGLEDGENVRLVGPGDEAAFGAALDDLLADESRARALGAGARADGRGVGSRSGPVRRSPGRRARGRAFRPGAERRSPCSPERHRARRAPPRSHAACAGRVRAPRSTCGGRAAAPPTWRSSTSSRHRRPAAATSSSGRSCASSSPAGSRSS